MFTELRKKKKKEEGRKEGKNSPKRKSNQPAKISSPS